MVRYDFVDWRGRTDDCGGVTGGVGSAFIGLGRREGLGDVLGLAAIAAHDVFGDEGGVIEADVLDDVGVARELEEEDACPLSAEAGVEGACSAASSEGGGVCGAGLTAVDGVDDAGVSSAASADLGVSAGLGFFAWRSRIC